MYITAGSTVPPSNEWFFMGSTGYIFLIPDSTSPTNNGLAVVDRMGGTADYSGVLLSPVVISGATTSPYIFTSFKGATSAVWFSGITYSALVTNYANYLYIEGNTVGGAPGIQALGSDTDIDIQVLPKGAGVFRLNYSSVALGGGAAPTFGTIGGSGPSAAGQAAWGKVKFGATIYFVPLWST